MPRKIVSICDFKIKAEVIQLSFKKELKKIEDEKTFKLATFDSWKRGTRPSLKKLESFCELIGLPVTDIMKPLNEFAQAVADIKGEKPEDILAFIRGIRQQNEPCHTDKDEPYQFLSNTAGYLGKHAVINDFKLLKGHYDAYFYWSEHRLLRVLIEITDINENINAMTCQMKTDRGEYKGLLIGIDTKFFWLMECLPGNKSYPEMFVIISYKPTRRFNYPLMYGIITGGSRSKGGEHVDPSVPQASRVVLKRLKTVPENRKPGRLTKEELREYDPKDWELILKGIDNRIEQSNDILVAYSNPKA